MLLFDNSVEATTHRVVNPPELKTVNGDSRSLRPKSTTYQGCSCPKGAWVRGEGVEIDIMGHYRHESQEDLGARHELSVAVVRRRGMND